LVHDVREPGPEPDGEISRPFEGAAMSPSRRRLSAILHADLTGFVRLMEGGEDRTVALLKSAQADVWRPAIARGGGTVVNIVGDSVLAEFDSAVAAVATAIDLQERMTEFNSMLEDEQRLNFRIGLHLGEVIVDEETSSIFGDGVNVAARIQALAEPGGIAASRAVRDVAELRIEHAFVDGGEHRAKNVSRALQIYHVRPRAGAATQTTTSIAPRMTLHFRGADQVGKKFAFEVRMDNLLARRDGFVIGRDLDQCDIVLAHATVSRRHARLAISGEELRIEDLGSTNGTAVDGTEARPGTPRPLKAGASLKLGEIEFLVGGK
jgi:class 3 adenylate cyclase